MAQSVNIGGEAPDSIAELAYNRGDAPDTIAEFAYNHGEAPIDSISELAYIGDSVFEVLVREKLINQKISARALTKVAKSYVSAPAQAAMYHKIFPQLTEEEQTIAKRGRNLHNVSRAKSATLADYRHATGLEALFGFLHRRRDTARLQEVFLLCCEEKNKS